MASVFKEKFSPVCRIKFPFTLERKMSVFIYGVPIPGDDLVRNCLSTELNRIPASSVVHALLEQGFFRNLNGDTEDILEELEERKYLNSELKIYRAALDAKLDTELYVVGLPILNVGCKTPLTEQFIAVEEKMQLIRTQLRSAKLNAEQAQVYRVG